MPQRSTALSSLHPDHRLRLQEVRRASRSLRQASITDRNQVLRELISLLSLEEARILQANRADLEALSQQPSKATDAFRDRLALNPDRIRQMQESLHQVILLEDPLGDVTFERLLPNGLKLRQVRSPLGVILMIFESRPNVITEAFSLAFKSGNALILRGGSESLQTSIVLYELIERALQIAGLVKAVFWGVTDASRELSQALMKQHKMIDVLVPRGGDSLIHYVTENATIPIIKNDRGLCHVYLHEDADPSKAIDIVWNAKTQRPGVCNSMETLLVHQKQKHLLLRIHERLQSKNVQWFGCPETLKILAGKDRVQAATDESFETEYLDYKLNCKIVPSLEDAMEHIETHGSKHSESIVTESETSARMFQASVDAAVVYWNASTRFTDGYQFGLGGELGISTQKLHVRGPVGLKELTSLRWVVDGTGQIRS